MYLKVKELAAVMFSKHWSLVNMLSMSSHGGKGKMGLLRHPYLVTVIREDSTLII